MSLIGNLSHRKDKPQPRVASHHTDSSDGGVGDLKQGEGVSHLQ